MRPAAASLLEVADRGDADPDPFGELTLAESGRAAVPAQHRAEPVDPVRLHVDPFRCVRPTLVRAEYGYRIATQRTDPPVMIEEGRIDPG
ncbi:hypothetical protein GCM10007977_022780 [Dactylosporangium sucinum]|uniref:Uncharacterized protein n=1 Tax=Dactylosporangium sucinum TaxID=1424081 RepID=A0A917TEZ8_9ACTN|nr:hypothetical protein GCM10007977_022780 [Dactylosporangium sucinum]